MKYLLHLKGGGGCDYTLSCNETLEVLDAHNHQDALALAKIRAVPLVESYGIQQATLLDVQGSLNLPLKAWLAEAKEAARIKKVELDLAEKRKLYEKLKAELGESA